MTEDRNSILWRASSCERVDAAAIKRNLSVDLVIVGGGFTGCAASLEAARRGASVCVLDTETVGHGGSGRNVGLVNAGLWLPPDTIVAQLGQDAGRRLIQLLADAPTAFSHWSSVKQSIVKRRATAHCTWPIRQQELEIFVRGIARRAL